MIPEVASVASFVNEPVGRACLTFRRPPPRPSEVGPSRERAFGLINGPDRSLHPELADALANPVLDRVDLVVSFVMRSGLELIGGSMANAIDRGACVRVLTTDYMGITERSAVGWLLDRCAIDPDHQRRKRVGSPSECSAIRR